MLPKKPYGTIQCPCTVDSYKVYRVVGIHNIGNRAVRVFFSYNCNMFETIIAMPNFIF